MDVFPEILLTLLLINVISLIRCDEAASVFQARRNFQRDKTIVNELILRRKCKLLVKHILSDIQFFIFLYGAGYLISLRHFVVGTVLFFGFVCLIIGRFNDL